MKMCCLHAYKVHVCNGLHYLFIIDSVFAHLFVTYSRLFVIYSHPVIQTASRRQSRQTGRAAHCLSRCVNWSTRKWRHWYHRMRRGRTTSLSCFGGYSCWRLTTSVGKWWRRLNSLLPTTSLTVTNSQPAQYCISHDFSILWVTHT